MMDERIFSYKPGRPIPEWDLRHRLPINTPVGPECKDTATIFRINSAYMDVTDQPYMYKQMLAGGVLFACAGAGASLYIAIRLFLEPSNKNGNGFLSFLLVVLCGFFGFAYVAFRTGRDEFFSLKRRPIRFNRKEQKIYTIRRRRFFAKPGEGDVTWEVPWNAQSIFCIHRSNKASDDAYHIRHYTVDEHGNVVRAFAIGRQWEGRKNVQGLLSQWNYWCEYMNQGPAELPKPALFFSEHESTLESWQFCMFEMGVGGLLSWIIGLPFIVLHTAFRRIAQLTSRDPVWPEAVEAVSVIVPCDTYDEPRGATPVGWVATAAARARNDWPFDPKRKVANWHGEQDPARNARLWTENNPPNMVERELT